MFTDNNNAGVFPSLPIQPPMGEIIVPPPNFNNDANNLESGHGGVVRNFKIAKKEEIEIPWGSDLRMGLGWQIKGGKVVDLDASAVLYDGSGALLDAVFFNQLQTKDGSMTHSGDNRNGVGEGEDEVITMMTANIHPSVAAIAIVVNAFKGGDFSDVTSTYATIRDLTYNVEVVSVDLPNCSGHHSALILAILYRTQAGTWRIRNTSKNTEGRTFLESEYKIRKLLAKLLNISLDFAVRNYDYASRAFNLEKNIPFYLPSSMERIHVALGWDILNEYEKVDLDGSLISFDKDDVINDSVIFYAHKFNANRSIIHSGDNRTGDEVGDDERITIHLPTVPPEVKRIYITVNVFSVSQSFKNVKNAYVRLLDANTMNEICRYSIYECDDFHALVLAKIVRDGNEWKVQAIGEFMEGQTCLDVVPAIKKYEKKLRKRIPHQKCVETTVVVVEAKNLAAKDRGGTSDPYVKLTISKDHVLKTDYKKKTLNPVWNAEFLLKGKVKGFKLSVFDHDLLKDDLIGKAYVDLLAIPFDQEVVTSYKVYNKSMCEGEVFLRIHRVSKWVGK